jgi:hypothetical protein
MSECQQIELQGGQPWLDRRITLKDLLSVGLSFWPASNPFPTPTHIQGTPPSHIQCSHAQNWHKTPSARNQTLSLFQHQN